MADLQDRNLIMQPEGPKDYQHPLYCVHQATVPLSPDMHVHGSAEGQLSINIIAGLRVLAGHFPFRTRLAGPSLIPAG